MAWRPVAARRQTLHPERGYRVRLHRVGEDPAKRQECESRFCLHRLAVGPVRWILRSGEAVGRQGVSAAVRGQRERRQGDADAAALSNWHVIADIEFLPSLLNPHEVIEILEIAGMREGLGDWRPKFGKFSVKLE